MDSSHICWSRRCAANTSGPSSGKTQHHDVSEVRVTRLHHDSDSTKFAVLKVFYLLLVTAVTFTVPAFAATRPAQWFVVPALLAVQIFALLACRIRVRE